MKDIDYSMACNLPPGPWSDEPDRLEWKTAYGHHALILRNMMGALCGYVAVPPGHRVHGKHYDEVNVYVHGGLTYANHCNGRICHDVEGEDNVWWLGFDCAHYCDFVPSYTELFKRYSISYVNDNSDIVYRNIDYVRNECELLSAQIAGME